MTILWSFSYNFFVKFHGKNIWACYIQIHVITRLVIKGVHSTMFQMEKRHKQFEYARMVMEKNRMELGHKKPPKFPRETKEENHKRKVVSRTFS